MENSEVHIKKISSELEKLNKSLEMMILLMKQSNKQLTEPKPQPTIIGPNIGSDPSNSNHSEK